MIWLVLGCQPPPPLLPLGLDAGQVWRGSPVSLSVSGLIPGEVATLAIEDDGGPRWLDPIVADGPTVQIDAHLDPIGDRVWIEAQAGPRRSDRVGRPVYVPTRGWASDYTITSSEDVAVLSGIATIAGDLWIQGTALTTLALPDLVEVSGNLRIWENPDLTTVSLPALTTVGGDLSLYDDPEVVSLLGLGALARVGGTLAIHRMPGLVDLRGLDQVREIGALYLYHDVALESLAGLEGLQSVDGDVELWELYALHEANFASLHTIRTKLDLFECDALDRLIAPELTSLRAYELHNCDGMTDLGEFPQVDGLLGPLRIQYNDRLVSLAGMPALATVDTATFRSNPALETLADLGALATVGGLLEVRDDDALTSLDLGALTTVGSLSVYGHRALMDPGLPALQVAESVSFHGNPMLPNCALEDLFARITVDQIVCYANQSDACTTWCDPEAL